MKNDNLFIAAIAVFLILFLIVLAWDSYLDYLSKNNAIELLKSSDNLSLEHMQGFINSRK
jgi:hypothetical protein